jgi:hypothetical protein
MHKRPWGPNQDDQHLALAFRNPVVIGGGTPFLPPVTEDVPLELIRSLRQRARLFADARAGVAEAIDLGEKVVARGDGDVRQSTGQDLVAGGQRRARRGKRSGDVANG